MYVFREDFSRSPLIFLRQQKKTRRLFLQLTEFGQKFDFFVSLIMRRVIMAKLNTCFLFGHREVIVVSLAFWVTFGFD